jgi:hypothetical protein
MWKMSMFEGEWVRNVTAGGYDLGKCPDSWIFK